MCLFTWDPFVIAGFDFDLDEVWAPLNPHLRGALYNKSSGGCSSGGSSTTASSSSEVSSEGRPMKSVLGEDESRAPTARLFGRRSGSRSNGPEVCGLILTSIAHRNMLWIAGFGGGICSGKRGYFHADQ